MLASTWATGQGGLTKKIKAGILVRFVQGKPIGPRDGVAGERVGPGTAQGPIRVQERCTGAMRIVCAIGGGAGPGPIIRARA